MPVPSSIRAILSRSGPPAARAAARARDGFSPSSRPMLGANSSAWSSSSATFTPASADGTMPNAVRALNRPPTSESARMTWAPISRPIFSSGEPGSVTMTKCRPTSSTPASENACQYTRRWASVSTVDPDLLATTTTVRSSRSASAARTWCGSVVSSTVNATSRVRVMTSGASDEPPMPASTMWSSPARR